MKLTMIFNKDWQGIGLEGENLLINWQWLGL